MGDLKIFTDNIEPNALNQIYQLIKLPAFSRSKVRIMPDVHSGAGCVIGFTADLGDKVIPNIVGVDIGCGMLTVELGKCEELDFDKLDRVIRHKVPSGRDTHSSKIRIFPAIREMHCYKKLGKLQWAESYLGTLGGGNHFIEVDKDEYDNLYLIIHSGSRNVGCQVAMYYQDIAVRVMRGEFELEDAHNKLILDYKASGRHKEIESALKSLHKNFVPHKLDVPESLCYLTGTFRDMYLHDMKICQEFASLNRRTIAEEILGTYFGTGYDLSIWSYFETVHNYIDLESNIVRKGAISARQGERLLIPINMRDGCILGTGKGNDDWNQSAPHGAGRLFSRSEAKQVISLEDYQESMGGIYSTCVNASTLDESPMAYKSMEEIIDKIQDTVKIENILKPVYNFKASKEPEEEEE